MIRLLLAVVLLELGFFWLHGGWQIAAYLLGATLLGTAAVRFCPLYRLLGLRTLAGTARSPGRATAAILVLMLIAAIFGGSYASHFFTRKVFLQDFSAVNHDYKQTLFMTGKNEREKAVAHYESLMSAYQPFRSRYSAFKPYALRGDAQFDADLVRVAGMLRGVNQAVHTGDLHQAHLDLEKVRPVFQDIFKRNGFSMLAVALVDFHDAMELILDAANEKAAPKLIALYPQVSEKLKAVESEANDEEIQAIRKNLDDLLALAKDAGPEQLATKGEALKSSFIKVYLKRG